MPVDYAKIRDENDAGAYTEKIKRIIEELLVDSYADRTHFIFELLQNAEDAIHRRDASWSDSRKVSFLLSSGQLRFGHYGKPFDEDDIRGICGILESTKSDDSTTIGRFGIGFKSVYKFTKRPEVHSGDEDFVIDDYVMPTASDPIQRDPDETVFLFPLPPESRVADNEEIANALRKLDVRTFLFLRQIEELMWEIEGCGSGHYLRETKINDEIARQVNVIGQVKYLDGNASDVNEEWMVFSREVQHEGKTAGNVEIAFHVDEKTKKIRRLEESKLVVYFPTALETHLGFLVQGPYLTTPNRDNVHEDDDWNRYLIAETGLLLQDTLKWLRDQDLLDAEVLGCLPLKSYASSIVAPLFNATQESLTNEALLPKADKGYISAKHALIARSGMLRELFAAKQLSELLGRKSELRWLDDSIRQDPTVREYVIKHLKVQEIRPERLINLINPTFLMRQSDKWLQDLYIFLKTRSSIVLKNEIPLIRLEDGKHVVPFIGGEAQAFLPCDVKTGFPTVKRTLCGDPSALSFLQSLGLKQPDPVDDIIRNILPRYKNREFEPNLEQYTSDIELIYSAYQGANPLKRQTLRDALRKVAWVKGVDICDGLRRRMSPNSIYLPTDSLKILFSVVSGFMFIDEEVEILQSKEVQELLNDCGAVDHLRPIDDNNLLGDDELRELRRSAGHERTSGRNDSVKGYDLLEVAELLYQMPELAIHDRKIVSRNLWEELANLYRIDGAKYFESTYIWTHNGSYSKKFDPKFIRKLNNTSWIPMRDGALKQPSEVLFSDLDWGEHSFLLDKIEFKSPKRQQLAREFGLDEGVLNLLKNSGVTTESAVRELLSMANRHDGSKQNGKALAGRQSDVEESSDSGIDTSSEGFIERLLDAQWLLGDDPDSRVIMLPPGGPKTQEMASRHTRESRLHGRSGTSVLKSVQRWEPKEASKKLASEFQDMVHGDYSGRCQICGSSFGKSDGQLQVYVVHVLPPSSDERTNHYGNLLGLCGRHYSLIRYGKWHFIDPETNAGFYDTPDSTDREQFQAFVESRDASIDDEGNDFFGLPIRFLHVYDGWETQAKSIDAIIRYNRPHWQYFRELLKI